VSEREARREERARKIAKKVYANLLDDRVRRVLLILFMSGPMTIWQIYKRWTRQMLYGVDADVKQIAYTTLLTLFGLTGRGEWAGRKNKLAYLVWVREVDREVDKRRTKIVQLTELGMKIMKGWLFEGVYPDYQTLVDTLLEDGLMERLPMPPALWWQEQKRRRESVAKHNTTHSICSSFKGSSISRSIKKEEQINTPCSLKGELQEDTYRTTETTTAERGKGVEGVRETQRSNNAESKNGNNGLAVRANGERQRRDGEGKNGKRRSEGSGGKSYIVCDGGKVRKVDKTEVKALWRVLKEAINERDITASEFSGCVVLYLRLRSWGWTIGEIWKAIKLASKRVALRALEVMKFVYVHISELLHEWKVKLETYVQLKRAEREEREAKKERKRLLKKVREAKERVFEMLRRKEEEGKEVCEVCGKGVVYREHEGKKLCNECWTKEVKEKNLKILKKMIEREEKERAVRETAKQVRVGGLTKEDEEEIKAMAQVLIEQSKERVRVCEICGQVGFKEWDDGRILCRLHFSLACLGKLEEVTVNE
jgi:hypothetical protein